MVKLEEYCRLHVMLIQVRDSSDLNLLSISLTVCIGAPLIDCFLGEKSHLSVTSILSLCAHFFTAPEYIMHRSRQLPFATDTLMLQSSFFLHTMHHPMQDKTYINVMEVL